MIADTPEAVAGFLQRDAPTGCLLVHGDALTTLKSFPASSVDMVMTSPPYWGQRKYSGDSSLGQETTYQEYVAHLLEIFAELPRILRPEGSFWLWGILTGTRTCAAFPGGWRWACRMQAGFCGIR